ncbi:UDP-glucose--hexose-1-phosphate uridylyltransferase [Shouchella sp. 1P09AA]|uniref:UDP-glucose--hexose-1-phosphate uridylyltransferase n=1 Tax=unclassified Shouchella TaxID=2893065 RepID=UPI00399F901E
MVHIYIEQLLLYGLRKNLFLPEDKHYLHNRLLEFLHLDYPEEVHVIEEEQLENILPPLLDWAFSQGLISHNTVTHRDLFDTAIMNLLLPRPSDVTNWFRHKENNYGPETATKSFYQFNKHSNYIRMDRIQLNESWHVDTSYGPLDITINLSKPEKDPTALAAARKQVQLKHYPNGPLAKENIGFKGSLNHPARHNLRYIPVTLAGEEWYFQFSPYVYYNEHAIIFSGEQKPMVINETTFERLFDFIDQYPHYFIGSNADLPIVGGSILEHDHYQGGMHSFPMAHAPLKQKLSNLGFPTIEAGVVKWPMSVIRLSGTNRSDLIAASSLILKSWRSYSDHSLDLVAFTENEQHNTITPVLRMTNDHYELDLVLRNNRTTDEHPLGLFHPHQEAHAIKKENIGLIEVMGLAILPGRLKKELEEIAAVLLNEHAETSLSQSPYTQKHRHWATELKRRLGQKLTKDNIDDELKKEVGHIFMNVLHHAGVFKDSKDGLEGFNRFWAYCERNGQ